MPNQTWITKDGKKMLLSDMSTAHLRNAIRFLQRQARAEESGYWQAGCMLTGEQATLAWEAAAPALDRYVAELNEKARILQTELDRRETEERAPLVSGK